MRELASHSVARMADLLMDHVCAVAQVSKRTAYQHFTNKVELVAEYLRRFDPDVMPQVFDRTDLTPRERLSAAFDLPAATPLCPYIAAAVELHDPQHPASQYAHDYKVAIAARLTATAHEAGATNPEQLGEQLALLLDGASARTRALKRESFSTVAAIAAVLITTPSPRRFHRSRAMTAEPSDLLLSRRVANDNSRHLVGRNNDGPGRSCMRPDDGVGL